MISVSNLVKTFGDFTAVKDITFDVAQGEIFAFLGPNGAGKTTTIKMLTTLLRPTSGRIELDGLDPTVKQKLARQRFGIVFQDPSLDDEQTAYENMDLHGVLYHVPRKVRAERTEELLKLFELWERKDAYVKTFSGGMKRRLEIARGFLHTPKILFLDEPTLGLDPQSRNQLWTHVKRLNETEKTTVFLTTHYMDEADRVAHRIAIMDHGTIVAQGTSAELKEQTKTDSLEAAFLALTGSSLRDEGANSSDRLAPGGADVSTPLSQAIVRREIRMGAIYILWLRELKRYVRSRVQIVVSLGQPCLYLLALGFGLGPGLPTGRPWQLSAVHGAGVIGMTVLFSSVFSGIAMLWDRQFGFLKETLVAPVSRMQIMIGRTLGGATVAVIQGTLILVICLIAGFRPHSWFAIPLAFLFVVMIAIVFAAWAPASARFIKDMQGFQLVMNFLVMPIFFLSGALFPLANLPLVMSIITKLDPLAYGVDGLRGALINTWHFSLMFDVTLLAAIAALFLGAGAYLFSRIEA